MSYLGKNEILLLLYKFPVNFIQQHHFKIRQRIIMDDYKQNKHFEFGTNNPTIMEKPFWKFMCSNPHLSAYDARSKHNDMYNDDVDICRPVWCFTRFGATQTYLPDGRLICIGGEHEDSYDPDFQIFNDVVIIQNPCMVQAHYMYSKSAPENFPLESSQNSSRRNPKVLGTENSNDVLIYGYPEDVFPPTDFHTATYVKNEKTGNEFIYIIGGLGYMNSSRRRETHVYRLHLSDFSIHQISTSGTGPVGCTHDHHAVLQTVRGRNVIRITLKNGRRYQLDVETGIWKKVSDS